MSLPEWLVAKMHADNPDGVTRAARLERCGGCGARVLAGLDDELCALAVTVTPIELDHYGEYLALARGLRTYDLARRFTATGKPRWELDERSHWQIRAAKRKYPVVPAHACRIWLPTLVDGLLAKTPRPASEYQGPPPF